MSSAPPIAGDASLPHSSLHPGQITIRTSNIPVSQIIDRIQYQELDLPSDFQTLRESWNRDDQSRLIESLLLQIPIPAFYIATNDQGSWSVIDGLQRLSTIFTYIDGGFPLQGLQYLIKFNNFEHNDLPRSMQRRISETQLVVHVIEPSTPQDVMFNIAVRINTASMTLNGQEIRHALIPGPARDYLKSLAGSEEFQKASSGLINRDRMIDREYVLGFLAFHMMPLQDNVFSNFDSYLDKAMKRINQSSEEEREQLATDFKKAMCAILEIFGDAPFRHFANVSSHEYLINIVAFASLSFTISNLDRDQVDRIHNHKSEIRVRFLQLVDDQGSIDAFSSPTDAHSKVHRYFSTIQGLIKAFT